MVCPSIALPSLIARCSDVAPGVSVSPASYPLFFRHIWLLPHAVPRVEHHPLPVLPVVFKGEGISAEVRNDCGHAHPLPPQLVFGCKGVVVGVTYFLGIVKMVEDLV